jgi:hypothetical protein
MPLEISAPLRTKAQGFPESSYGANLVTLILSDNRKIKNVILAWGSEIEKIENKPISSEDDINFKVAEIKDIVSEI